MVSFGERLRMERLKKGFSLDKVAKDINTTKATLSRYEKNQREPKLDMLGMLADYYECSVDYLMGRCEDRNFGDKKTLEHKESRKVSKKEILIALELIKIVREWD